MLKYSDNGRLFFLYEVTSGVPASGRNQRVWCLLGFRSRGDTSYFRSLFVALFVEKGFLVFTTSSGPADWGAVLFLRSLLSLWSIWRRLHEAAEPYVAGSAFLEAGHGRLGVVVGSTL